MDLFRNNPVIPDCPGPMEAMATKCRLTVSFRSHPRRDPAPQANALRPFKPKVAGSTPVGRIRWCAVHCAVQNGIFGLKQAGSASSRLRHCLGAPSGARLPESPPCPGTTSIIEATTTQWPALSAITPMITAAAISNSAPISTALGFTATTKPLRHCGCCFSLNF